jgi:hypothetical protein
MSDSTLEELFQASLVQNHKEKRWNNEADS